MFNGGIPVSCVDSNALFFIFSTNERVLMSPTTQSCSVFLTLSHRCWGCLEHRSLGAMPLAAFSKTFTFTKSHNRTLLSHNCKKVAFVIRWMYRNSKYRGPHLTKDYYMPEVMSMEGRKNSDNGMPPKQEKSLILKRNCERIVYSMWNCWNKGVDI